AVAERTAELARLEKDIAEYEARRDSSRHGREERNAQLVALETAAGEASGAPQAAALRLEETERELAEARRDPEAKSEEHHGLAVAVTEARAERRRIVDRVETEWKQPFAALVEIAPPVEADLETLEQEAERIGATLEAIGVVNPLAVEEHAEEATRLQF